MSGLDVLRGAVAAGAMLVLGAVLVVFAIYLRAALGGARGRLRIRHVAEVSAGTALLVAGVGIGVWDTVGALSGPPVSRLLMYLTAELLLLVALLDVGNHLRGRR